MTRLSAPPAGWSACGDAQPLAALVVERFVGRALNWEPGAHAVFGVWAEVW
jgi:hypothetical protein